MANPDFIRGLQPWGPLLRANLYCLVTSIGAATYHGDMMETSHACIASKFGNYTSVVAEATGAVSTIVGAAIGIFDENMDPVMYIANAATGDLTVAGYVLIADHPEQLFVCQEDGDGGVCGVADAGQNADLINTNAGVTGTGLSGMEIDSSTVTTTSTLAIQLLNPVPDQDATLAHCDWICKINATFLGNNIAGV